MEQKTDDWGGRACCLRAGYHAVLGVKGSRGTRSASGRPLTPALPRGARCAGNPAPLQRFKEFYHERRSHIA